MADAGGSESCGLYWDVVTLHCNGQSVEVTLSPSDIDRVNKDPQFALDVFNRYTAVMTEGKQAEGMIGSADACQQLPPKAGIGAKRGEGLIGSAAACQVLPKAGVAERHQNTWSPEATLNLISSWVEHKRQRESPTVKMNQWWAMIAEDLTSNGHCYSADQCSTKWRSLKQHYTKLVDSTSKTGMSKMAAWRFFKAMQEALADDPVVRPDFVINSARPNPPQSSPCASTSSSSSPILVRSSSTASPILSPKPKRKKKSEWSKTWEEFRSEQKTRHEEKMVELKRKNDLLQKLVESLTK